ncbi:MAG: PilN domain-containing protein, partial [Kiritimatiellales bacterium]|nr:PilN domain-containing protein [Kiritimatiellales bacterium]
GSPLAFRTLQTQLSDPAAADDLAYEIGYTLTALDTEREMPAPAAIQFWTRTTLPKILCETLREKSGLTFHNHDLGTLPPLSEGIVRRSQKTGSHIELIPREWIDHEIRKQLNRKTIKAASIVVGVWLAVMLVFFSVYKTRDIQLSKVQRRADAIAPAAKTALENRQKLRALKAYTDRSSSALECLREVTRMLPAGDIDFVSYNYNKEKGISLRGSSSNDDTVYDFFKTLTTSKLFEHLKDQSVNTKTTKGVRRSVYSVTLVLPVAEEGP